MRICRFQFSLSIIGLTALAACSSTEIQPMRELPAEAPAYTRVPHPEGLNLQDLHQLFAERDAPSRDSETIKTCDANFIKLKSKVDARKLFQAGVREMVHLDPVKYHWCFYSKLLALEEKLHQSSFIDEKQSAVVDTYAFLAPVSRAFLDEFKDSRYIRWAIAHYRLTSERVFYRRVEVTPALTSEMVGAQSPYTNVRPLSDPVSSVVEKYGIVEKPAAPEKPFTSEKTAFSEQSVPSADRASESIRSNGPLPAEHLTGAPMDNVNLTHESPSPTRKPASGREPSAADIAAFDEAVNAGGAPLVKSGSNEALPLNPRVDAAPTSYPAIDEASGSLR